MSGRPFSIFPEQDPEQPKRRHDDLDWKKRAPRWVLVTALIVAFVVLGGLSGRVVTLMDREAQNVAAAIAVRPTEESAQLRARVAVTEAQISSMAAAVDRLSLKVEESTRASDRLAGQMELLRAEIRRGR